MTLPAIGRSRKITGTVLWGKKTRKTGPTIRSQKIQFSHPHAKRVLGLFFGRGVVTSRPGEA
jgi:hypothetical protein